ncbi:MAG: hypothetical protein ABI569_08070 [Casimicrobiaceae bacterium]
MRHPSRPYRSNCVSIALGVGLAVFFAPAWAAQQRSFVASTGLDTSPCNLAAPCRSFNAAILQTNAGGEVVILDTAGYGPVTITKSIKIVAPAGVYGGVSVLGGTNPTTGIVINAAPTDDITLAGLAISALPGAPPLALFGIDVQSAGAVHIDRVTVSNFTQDPGACIHVAPTTVTRVYVNDSFLRGCRTGIFADGTAVPVAGDRPFVVVDNTRIERGRGAIVAYGAWLRGYAGLSLRNSVISEQRIGVQFDGLLANGPSLLELINAEIMCGAAGSPNTGLNVSSTAANGLGLVSITGSQFSNCEDLIVASNTGVGAISTLKLSDSRLSHAENGLRILNSAANARTDVDLVRSQISETGTSGIDANATNGGAIAVDLRDSTVSTSFGPGVKTSGAGSSITASLIRSSVHGTVTAVDHGQGRVYLEQSHITRNTNSLINNGSGDVKSAGNNFITDNLDATPATTYITSFTTVTLK